MGREHAVDKVFDALGDQNRRTILRLLAADNPRAETELAAELAADGGDHTTARLQLRHVHLPKLAALSYVDWDAEAETVERGPAFGQVAVGLRLLEEYEAELAGQTP